MEKYNWELIAKKLWGLLDDISTLDDACKSDDSAFRRAAYKVAEKRNDYMHSPDGFTLEVSSSDEFKIKDDS